jgi:starch phosphorylase
MAALALRLSTRSNGVSILHGQVARRMFQRIWPGLPEAEVPIRTVTNGAHTRSWISRDMATLYDRYLGPRWAEDPGNPRIWQRVDNIPDEELWRTHERRRERLVAFARRRVREQIRNRGGSRLEIDRAGEILHPETLTIGFARRFATYKRAALILRSLDRLRRVLTDRQRPVQIIFAGKAHPQDNEGKELIRRIMHALSQEDLRKHIVFLENYDMNVARYLVQGVDVWLNNPVRLREASGTSGMKAAMNGVINMSVLDGWWDEAYQPEIGWAIGRREVYESQGYQDEVESNAIYNLLEEEVVPLFYRRGTDDLPRDWIARMKASIRVVGPAFNTNRMVYDYSRDFYMPAAQRYAYLSEDNMTRARVLAQWKSRVRQLWPQVRIESVQADATAEPKVGTDLGVQATIYLGMLEPADVSVELYHGPVDAQGQIVAGEVLPLAYTDTIGDGSYLFAGAIPCRISGRYGYALRVLPDHADLSDPFETRLIRWNDGEQAGD